jgi:hypothetical protein
MTVYIFYCGNKYGIQKLYNSTMVYMYGNMIGKKEYNEYYRKHKGPLEHILQEKPVKKTLCWRTCKLFPIDCCNQLEEHAGEYWCAIRTFKEEKICGLDCIDTEEMKYKVHVHSGVGAHDKMEKEKNKFNEIDVELDDNGENEMGYAKDRMQVLNPKNKKWVKIDTKKGRIVSIKSDSKPYKGIRKT